MNSVIHRIARLKGCNRMQYFTKWQYTITFHANFPISYCFLMFSRCMHFIYTFTYMNKGIATRLMPVAEYPPPRGGGAWSIFLCKGPLARLVSLSISVILWLLYRGSLVGLTKSICEIEPNNMNYHYYWGYVGHNINKMYYNFTNQMSM